MATSVTPSMVHHYATMAPQDFGESLAPRWKVAERLLIEVRAAVENEHLTPLEGARLLSAIAATLFGYDELILREISPEVLLATSIADGS